MSLILNSQHPMWVGWGRSMWFLYNDAYLHVLGQAKHPWALGRPAEEVWREIWDFCGPLADNVFDRGEASFIDEVRLFMNRGTFLEETFYSFSYSPIRDESGAIGGLFCPSNDVTPKVVGARRLRTLSELTSNALAQKTIESASSNAMATLAKNPDDIPFALLFLADSRGAGLTQAAGFSGAVPEVAWPIEAVLECGEARAFSVREIAGMPLGPAGQPVVEARIIPVAPRAEARALGVLVVGLNPTARLGADYDAFLELVASNIGTAVQNATAVEDERRRADELAKLDRAKTSFFSNVSHEFRTPLTLLLSPLADLIESRPSPEAGSLLRLAHRNALRLQKLANTLLDFSRLEAGRTNAVFVPSDVAQLTIDLASNFQSACQRSGLRLIVDCPTLPEPVYVDRAMWEKIVLNLLSNALKFTFEGAIEVRLRADGDAALLTVKDSGVGIPREELPRLFERFHRIESQRRRTFEGSGIGLALVDELVRLHGGSVSATSEVDIGTEIAVRIPFGIEHLEPERIKTGDVDFAPTTAVEEHLAEVDATLGGADDAVFARPASTSQRARILLADDNPDLRAYVSRVISAHHDVVAVSDGVDALEAARRETFDLVISDVMMPRMDGFALLAALRADPQLRATPVLMLSARAGEEAAVEGLEHGADDYLAKPFSANELRARVSAQISAARARREKLNFDLEAREWFTAPGEETISATSFRAIADQLPFIVWLHDSEGAVSFLNETFHSITKLPRDGSELTVSGWQRCIHPDDLQRNLTVISAAVQERAPYEFEHRMKPAGASDAAYRWYAIRGMPQYHDGTFLGWLGVGTDVQAQKEVAERNRRIAQVLQEHFLPTFLPSDERLQVDAIYQAADTDSLVGGDWYDAVQLGGARFLFSVGDVTGHGVAAASVAARLRHAILDYAFEHEDPSDVIRRANSVLRREHEGTYATALVALVDLDRLEITYASAGHPPPLLAYKPDLPALELPKGGLTLGVEDDCATSTVRVPLLPGAVLALYTDGIVEFDRDPASAEHLLRGAVSAAVAEPEAARPAVAIREAVLRGAATTDDAALVVVRVHAGGHATLTAGDGHWRFDSRDAEAARRCRAGLVDALRALTHDPEALFSAELLLGEALANAVRHAPGIVDVRLDRSEHPPVLKVTDAGHVQQTCRPREVDVLRESGRGLFLIDALSQGFEMEHVSGMGTEVRIVLPVGVNGSPPAAR